MAPYDCLFYTLQSLGVVYFVFGSDVFILLLMESGLFADYRH